MNTKIALSALSIFAALALTGGAAFAFFSSTASSTSNAFGTGTMTLLLDDHANASPVPSLTGTFNVTGMVPGQREAQEISFHNGGSTEIKEIAMGETSSANGAADLRTKLNLTVMDGGSVSGDNCTGGTDVTSAIDTKVGDGSSPLTAIEFNGKTYDSLPIDIPAGGNDKVCITATMDSSADNTFEDVSASLDFAFTAHQDTSQ